VADRDNVSFWLHRHNPNFVIYAFLKRLFYLHFLKFEIWLGYPKPLVSFADKTHIILLDIVTQHCLVGSESRAIILSWTNCYSIPWIWRRLLQCCCSFIFQRTVSSQWTVHAYAIYTEGGCFSGFSSSRTVSISPHHPVSLVCIFLHLILCLTS
jgi:hypothetical protein